MPMLHWRESCLRLIAELTTCNAPTAERASSSATYSVYAPPRRLRHVQEAHTILGLDERRLKLVLVAHRKHSWIVDLMLSRFLNHPDGGLTRLIEQKLGEFGFLRRVLWQHIIVCRTNVHLTGCEYILVFVLERCKSVIENVVPSVALMRAQALHSGWTGLLVGASHIGNSHGPVDLFVSLGLVGQVQFVFERRATSTVASFVAAALVGDVVSQTPLSFVHIRSRCGKLLLDGLHCFDRLI